VGKGIPYTIVGIRFVGSSSQRTHDGLCHAIKRLYKDVRQGNNPLGGYEEVLPHENSEFNLHFWASNKRRASLRMI
jgi:hypothetical protein